MEQQAAPLEEAPELFASEERIGVHHLGEPRRGGCDVFGGRKLDGLARLLAEGSDGGLLDLRQRLLVEKRLPDVLGLVALPDEVDHPGDLLFGPSETGTS